MLFGTLSRRRSRNSASLSLLIDDLDRCLPETTISTLEAMRLFLFLKNAAFGSPPTPTMTSTP